MWYHNVLIHAREGTTFGHPIVSLTNTTAFDYSKYPKELWASESVEHLTKKFVRFNCKYELPHKVVRNPQTKAKVVVFSRVPKTITVTKRKGEDMTEEFVVNRFNQMCSTKVWEGIAFLRSHQSTMRMEGVWKNPRTIQFL